MKRTDARLGPVSAEVAECNDPVAAVGDDGAGGKKLPMRTRGKGKGKGESDGWVDHLGLVKESPVGLLLLLENGHERICSTTGGKGGGGGGGG